jgi:hypothetical protein
VSHRYDCPDESEARRKARSDASFDSEYGHRRYSGPYGDCDEAQRTYRNAYDREYQAQEYRREEEAAEARACQRREQARQDEEAYYAQQEEERYQPEEATEAGS